jgi:hypothetical protein
VTGEENYLSKARVRTRQSIKKNFITKNQPLRLTLNIQGKNIAQLKKLLLLRVRTRRLQYFILNVKHAIKK